MISLSGVSKWDQWQDRISNDHIRRELNVDSIDGKAREARLRWWGHVRRMVSERLPKSRG